MVCSLWCLRSLSMVLRCIDVVACSSGFLFIFEEYSIYGYTINLPIHLPSWGTSELFSLFGNYEQSFCEHLSLLFLLFEHYRCFPSSLRLQFLSDFDFSCSSGCLVAYCGFICDSLMTNNVECLSMYLFALHIFC